MTVTVVTCQLGQTDRLKRPTVINPAVDYLCIADRPVLVRPYRHVPMETPPAAGHGIELASRAIKILMDHPAIGVPDVVFWHDASFRLTSDPVVVATRYLAEHEFVTFRHPDRQRLEDEAAVIARLGYVARETVDAQVATYRAEGFPDPHPITSSGVSLRRTTPAVRAFNAAWWAEVVKWGWRDQMSVDYVLWKTGLPVQYLPGHYRRNTFAQWSAT